jgi:hypothetical protein
MTVTRSQRLAQQQAFEQAGQLPADRSTVVHEYGDGWHVVRLDTAGDLRREGLLMRNCLAQYAGDMLVSEQRDMIVLGPLMDCDPAPVVGCADLDVVPLRGRHVHAKFYSLRDEAGLPHLTWWAREKSHACSALGYRNAPPKAAYRKRLEQWAEASEIATYAHEDDWELYRLDVSGDAFGLAARTAFIEDAERLMRLPAPATRRGRQLERIVRNRVKWRQHLRQSQQDTEAALRLYRDHLRTGTELRASIRRLQSEVSRGIAHQPEDVALSVELLPELERSIRHISAHLRRWRRVERKTRRSIAWLMGLDDTYRQHEMRRYDHRRGNRRGRRR